MKLAASRRRHRTRGHRPGALRVALQARTGVDHHRLRFRARRYHATGELFTDDDLASLREHDAILLGAIGDPSVRRGARTWFPACCVVCDGPSRQPAAVGPAGRCAVAAGGNPKIDFVSPEARRAVHRQRRFDPRRHPHEGPPRSASTPGSVSNGWCAMPSPVPAQARAKLTLVHKTNVLVRRILWGADRGGWVRNTPTSTICHVDAATIYLVTDPSRFDVIVTDNLFGDIITDLAAAMTGGIGWPRPAISTPPAPTVDVRGGAAAHPTSPAREADPRPPSCRWLCCSVISAATTTPRVSRRRWPPMWPSVVTKLGTTTIGDRIPRRV